MSGKKMGVNGRPSDPIDLFKALRERATWMSQRGRAKDAELMYAAASEIYELRQAPVGWRLTPLEPTEDMCRAGKEAELFGPSARSAELVYCAMLEASPEFDVREVQIPNLSDRRVHKGWEDTFSTSNPFCPCDLKSFTKAVNWTLNTLRRKGSK